MRNRTRPRHVGRRVTTGSSSNTVTPAAPANTVAPSISGTPNVGQTLTVNPGTWTGTPAPTFTYQWNQNGAAISLATNSTYTPVTADLSQTITVTVTATNATGSVSATSQGVVVVIASPLDIAGCKLWLKADGTLWQDDARTTPVTADGQAVGSLDDGSTAANHATQATAGNRPVFKTNIANGKPVIRFDGVNDFLASTTSATSANTRTVLAVCKSTTAGGGTVFVNRPSGTRGFLARLLRSGGVTYVGGDLNTNATVAADLSTAWQSFCVGAWLQDPATTYLSFYLNSTQYAVTAGNPPDLEAGTAGYGLGRVNAGVAQYWTGDIAEWVVYDTQLSTANRNLVEQYLAAKYGITLPAPPAPSDLVATAVSTTTVHLRWVGNDSDGQSYRIERAPDAAGSPGTFAEVGSASTPALDYLDTTLSASTKYWYRVKVRNFAGTSVASSNATATTPASNTAGLTRPVTGLLYASEPTWAGWTGAAEWAVTSAPYFVCHPTGRTIIGPTGSGAGSEQDGVREGRLYSESGVWWMLYDSGDGIAGWIQHLASSTDRGLTWTRHGAQAAGYTRISSGVPWLSCFTGWVSKWGSTYYLFRGLASSLFGAPNTGLPAPGYHWDSWTGTSIDAVTTPSPNVPVAGYYTDGAETGSQVKIGSTYWTCLDTGSACYVVSSPAPDGPFDFPAKVAVCDSTTTGFGARGPENLRIFYSATLGKYVALVNLIGGGSTDASAAGISASLTDWSAASWAITQQTSSPGGDYVHAVGVASPVNGPDETLVEGAGGEVPVVFDGDAREIDPGWHLGRSIKGAVLEPVTAVLRCSQVNSSTFRITKAVAHKNTVLEAAYKLTTGNASTVVTFEYRSDSGGNNCYRFVVTTTGCRLDKVVAGTPTTLATGSGRGFQGDLISRCRAVIVGLRHRLYFDGQALIDFTEPALSSPIASGTNVGVASKQADIDLLQVRVYVEDTIRCGGVTPGGTTVLRTYGGLPVATAVADATGWASFAPTHWPHDAVEIAGADYTASHVLYGGDVVFKG